MINDITGLEEGVASAEVAGHVGAAYVVMHSIKRRGSLVHETSYDGVVAAVCQALSDSADRLALRAYRHCCRSWIRFWKKTRR